MPSMIKKNSKDILVLFTTFLVFFVALVLCGNNNADQIWEYGFSHNILQGMIPYKDFNMVTFPFHTYLSALILKIFSDKYIVYLIFHATLMSITAFLIYKKTNKVYQYLFSLLFFLIICAATYNILLLFLFYCILSLEEKNKNDYLIGVLLAFSILTKQSVGICLCLPSLFLTDKKRIKKRFVPILVIGVSYFLYLLATKTLYNCINYTIFGLLDFSNKNGTINLFFFLYIFYFLLLINQYRKKREYKYLYYISFSTVCIPLFDFHHFFVAIIPFVLDLISQLNIQHKILFRILTIYSFLTVLYILSFKWYDMHQYIIEKDKNNVFYLTREKYANTYKESASILDFYIKNKNKKIYIVGDSSYFFSLDNHIQITKLSLILYGNNGYNGNQNLKTMIDDLPSGTLFALDSLVTSKQHNKEIEEYIVKNSTKINKLSNHIDIYMKK